MNLWITLLILCIFFMFLFSKQLNILQRIKYIVDDIPGEVLAVAAIFIGIVGFLVFIAVCISFEKEHKIQNYESKVEILNSEKHVIKTFEVDGLVDIFPQTRAISFVDKNSGIKYTISTDYIVSEIPKQTTDK